eukprot:gb/GEZN01000262.1/.p1 GENE.gb/GEZN01000262.1/~~gb/GEZN01000262.1/.p1  ORF type:complete len:1652 (+),score=376.58 gb/GEZN01000262.1/:337-4956(+)
MGSAESVPDSAGGGYQRQSAPLYSKAQLLSFFQFDSEGAPLPMPESLRSFDATDCVLSKRGPQVPVSHLPPSAEEVQAKQHGNGFLPSRPHQQARRQRQGTTPTRTRQGVDRVGSGGTTTLRRNRPGWEDGSPTPTSPSSAYPNSSFSQQPEEAESVEEGLSSLSPQVPHSTPSSSSSSSSSSASTSVGIASLVASEKEGPEGPRHEYHARAAPTTSWRNAAERSAAGAAAATPAGGGSSVGSVTSTALGAMGGGGQRETEVVRAASLGGITDRSGPQEDRGLLPSIGQSQHKVLATAPTEEGSWRRRGAGGAATSSSSVVPGRPSAVPSTSDRGLEENSDEPDDEPDEEEAKPTDVSWYYKDPVGNIQGPFTAENMRGWYEQGYFTLRLLVCSALPDTETSSLSSSKFQPLGTYFLQGRSAFLQHVPEIGDVAVAKAQSKTSGVHSREDSLNGDVESNASTKSSSPSLSSTAAPTAALPEPSSSSIMSSSLSAVATPVSSSLSSPASSSHSSSVLSSQSLSTSSASTASTSVSSVPSLSSPLAPSSSSSHIGGPISASSSAASLPSEGTPLSRSSSSNRGDTILGQMVASAPDSGNKDGILPYRGGSGSAFDSSQQYRGHLPSLPMPPQAQGAPQAFNSFMQPRWAPLPQQYGGQQHQGFGGGVAGNTALTGFRSSFQQPFDLHGGQNVAGGEPHLHSQAVGAGVPGGGLLPQQPQLQPNMFRSDYTNVLSRQSSLTGGMGGTSPYDQPSQTQSLSSSLSSTQPPSTQPVPHQANLQSAFGGFGGVSPTHQYPGATPFVYPGAPGQHSWLPNGPPLNLNSNSPSVFPQLQTQYKWQEQQPLPQSFGGHQHHQYQQQQQQQQLYQQQKQQQPPSPQPQQPQPPKPVSQPQAHQQQQQKPPSPQGTTEDEEPQIQPKQAKAPSPQTQSSSQSQAEEPSSQQAGAVSPTAAVPWLRKNRTPTAMPSQPKPMSLLEIQREEAEREAREEAEREERSRQQQQEEAAVATSSTPWSSAPTETPVPSEPLLFKPETSTGPSLSSSFNISSSFSASQHSKPLLPQPTTASAPSAQPPPKQQRDREQRQSRPVANTRAAKAVAAAIPQPKKIKSLLEIQREQEQEDEARAEEDAANQAAIEASLGSAIIGSVSAAPIGSWNAPRVPVIDLSAIQQQQARELEAVQAAAVASAASAAVLNPVGLSPVSLSAADLLKPGGSSQQSKPLLPTPTQGSMRTSAANMALLSGYPSLGQASKGGGGGWGGVSSQGKSSTGGWPGPPPQLQQQSRNGPVPSVRAHRHPNGSAAAGAGGWTTAGPTRGMKNEDQCWGGNISGASPSEKMPGRPSMPQQVPQQASSQQHSHSSSNSNSPPLVSAPVSSGSSSLSGKKGGGGPGGNGNEFGGPTMSTEFTKWCQKELKNITGNSDTTLASYLMTLDSDRQIRETISQVLGDSKPVSDFAVAFLQNKSFETGKGVSQTGGNKKLGKEIKTGAGVVAVAAVVGPVVAPAPTVNQSGGTFSALSGDKAGGPVAQSKSSRRRQKKKVAGKK